MNSNIRFASIPKNATRSLKALGLLGEFEGRCHTKITDYPDWENYEWYAVDRPFEDWYRSWWAECHRMKSMFADWLGFTYASFEADIEKLENFESMDNVPIRWGINQWVPENFSEGYKAYLDNGFDFKKYCFDTITDGVPCKIVQLADLDEWLIAHGFETKHENSRVENAIS